MKEFLIFFVGLAVLLTGGGFAVKYLDNQGNTLQPIAFSHRAHTVFLQCSFCHPSAQSSASAGLPQTEKCMSCHQGQVTQNPEADKIRQYFQQGEDIPWVRLFDLSDDVIFSHKAHLRQGIECQSCHGNIAESDKSIAGFGRQGRGGPYGVQLMNSCVSCHQKREESKDCLTCHK